MIAGVGTDMIEVDRIAAKISKEMGFRELVFSKNEIQYCEARTNRYQHYAARFAAKEAFFKALGTGWKNGTSFHEVEVVHDEQGRPGIRLTGQTVSTLAGIGIRNILLSLTHLKTLASAIVIIET
ncbi:MAG TPA: holo-ACP synthase [Puia sp.]|nr:holo-ACP synthase [Puia sp.]